MTQPPKPITDDRHYKSVYKQGWKVVPFNFGKAASPNVAYFNPGLVHRPDGLWLITRRSENWRDVKIGMNSIMAFRLDKYKCPEYGIKVRCKYAFEGEHFEDARAIYHDGKTYISCCNFIVFPKTGRREKWTGAHINVQIVNDRWESMGRIDPVYGNNGSSLAALKGPEKNWLWFFHEQQLQLLYQAEPHTIIKWSNDFKVGETITSDNLPLPWLYGDIRGGTPPVLHEGLYWTFFHSSLKLDNKYHRRYYMGAYAFEPTAPFRIVRITPEPLLAGSDEDIWAEKKPLVVFPCGSIVEDGKWFVTIGVNDLISASVEFPHDELMDATISLVPDPGPFLKSLTSHSNIVIG